MTNNTIWIGILILVSMFAFSIKVRKFIFWRDKATCQNCGRKWGDGWYLMAAHKCHTRNGNYNNPNNGRMLCVDCHIEDHEEQMADADTEEERNFHAYAIRKLRETSPYRISR